MQDILYLHGFASSSRSDKAVQTLQYFQGLPNVRIRALDLPYTPAEAMHTLQQALSTAPQAIIGSSLGGFLATVMAERLGCRACVINPAVAPHQVLANYLGEYEHPVLQQRYQVLPEHMPLLQQLMPARLQQAAKYLVLLQTGDEVLDYRHAVSYYQGANMHIIAGGDHSFVNYQHYLPQIAEFCLQAE